MLIPPALYFRKFPNLHCSLGLLWEVEGGSGEEMGSQAGDSGKEEPGLSWMAVCPVVSSSLTGSTPGTADHSLAPGKSSRNRAQGSPSALTSSEPRLPPWPEPPRISLCFPLGQRGSGPGLPGLHLTPCGRQDGDRRRAAGPAQGGVDKVTDDPVLCEVGRGALCMSVSSLICRALQLSSV